MEYKTRTIAVVIGHFDVKCSEGRKVEFRPRQEVTSSAKGQRSNIDQL